MIGFINLAGLALIALIVWWFWLYQPAVVSASQSASDPEELTIRVENGVYLPARVQLPADQPITLRFLRKDSSPCAEMVLFDDLGVTQQLPLDQLIEVALPALSPGRYPFTCQMQMYRGELVVVASAAEPKAT